MLWFVFEEGFYFRESNPLFLIFFRKLPMGVNEEPMLATIVVWAVILYLVVLSILEGIWLFVDVYCFMVDIVEGVIAGSYSLSLFRPL